MTDAHVNQAARQDTVGVMLRQKQTLDRVSAVLCDGLGDEPSERWRMHARYIGDIGIEWLGDRLRAIADLIESERL